MPTHTVRAEGATTRTEVEPVTAALAVGLYIAGKSTYTVSDIIGIPQQTLLEIVTRLGVNRSQTEAQRIWAMDEEGCVSQVARQRILERDYTPEETLLNRPEIAERFNVSERTLRKDLKTIGYNFTLEEAQSIRYWGSRRAWYEAQQEAAILTRVRGLTQEEAADELGVCATTLRRLIHQYDERKS